MMYSYGCMCNRWYAFARLFANAILNVPETDKVKVDRWVSFAPQRRNNTLKLLIHGKEAFHAIHEAVESAKQEVARGTFMVF